MKNFTTQERKDLEKLLASQFARYGLDDFIQIAVGEAITALGLEEEKTKEVFSHGKRKAFVYKTAKNKILNEIRRDGKFEHYERSSFAGGRRELEENAMTLSILSDDGFELRELNRLEVEKALNKLSSKRREAIELHYLKGCSVEEIAERLNISVNSVKDRIKFGLKQLREILGANPPEKGG